MIAPINKNEKKKYKYNVYQTANKAFCLRPSQDSKQRSTFSTPTPLKTIRECTKNDLITMCKPDVINGTICR